MLHTLQPLTHHPMLMPTLYPYHASTHAPRDFETFKDMMLSYKQEVQGSGLAFDLQVSPTRPGWQGA